MQQTARSRRWRRWQYLCARAHKVGRKFEGFMLNAMLHSALHVGRCMGPHSHGVAALEGRKV